MRLVVLAIASALALVACNQSGEPPLPKTQAGAQAPSTLTPGPAGQQANLTPDQHRQLTELVSSYLDGVQNNFGEGMQPAAGFSDEVAGLRQGTDHRWQVNLVGGTPYRVLGACDNECSNLDIELIDVATGGVVASDMLPDDYPVVNYTPSANGAYIVRVIMQTCTIAPCYAGARMLSQSSAPAGK